MTTSSGSELISESGDLRVELDEESSAVRRLAVEVDAPRVREAFDRAYRELQRSAQVRGFRPGKVPRKVLERLYGASVVEEIERVLVSETLPEAIALAGLEPLLESGVEADKPAPDAVFRYRARVEVRPEIELPDPTSLTARRPRSDISDAEVEQRIEDLRRRNAPLVEEPEETEAELEHSLNIDFVGRVDGEVFEGGRGQGVDVELGSGRLVPGFEDQLLGAKAGEDRQVKVTFADDYASEDLRGKDAVFEVHIGSVRRRQLPDLDDEFAKDVGDFETLDELNQRVRTDLTQLRLQAAEATLRRTLLDSLVENTEVEVPPGVVERQLAGQMSSIQRQYQGQVPDEMLQAQLARMAEEGRPTAERRVREAFLLQAVAKVQSIEATGEDVDARLEEMAKAQGMSLSTMRGIAETGGMRDMIQAELAEEKALDFLISQATVEEIEDTENP
jgi:trigger factor